MKPRIHKIKQFTALFCLLLITNLLAAQSCTTGTSCIPLSGSNAIVNPSGNYCILAGTNWKGKFQNSNSSVNLFIEPGASYTGKNFGNFNPPNQLTVNSCGTLSYDRNNINAPQYQINILSGEFNFSGNIAGGEISISDGATWTGNQVNIQSSAKITINGTANFVNFENSNNASGSFVNFGDNANINITDTYYPHGLSTNNGTITAGKMSTQNNGSSAILTNNGTILVSTGETVIQGDYYINNGLWTSTEGFKLQNGALGGSGTYIAPTFDGFDQNNPCSDFSGSATFCNPTGGTPPPMVMENGQTFDPKSCGAFGGYSNACQSLPIELISFKQYDYETDHFYLEWEVTNAAGFSHFELEESNDSRNWNFKEKINFEYSSAVGIQYYQSGIYKSLKQDGYFRLKLVDLDGSFEYSKLIFVEGEEFDLIQVYPNPVKGDFFNLKVPTTEEILVQIYGVDGRLLGSEQRSGEEQYRLALPSGIQNNFIFVSVVCNNRVTGIKVLLDNRF